MSELKFIITGTAGVGKTTAITALSDIPPISTDAIATDELAAVKSTTTTAFDFGEIILDAETHVRIYGTPGQERFRHMWEILAKGALGLIILIDHTRPEPVEDLKIYLNNFSTLADETGVVVGITRVETLSDEETDKYYAALEEMNRMCPVMIVDPRSKNDMVMIMDALMSCVEHAGQPI